jgi:hypothetical protein
MSQQLSAARLAVVAVALTASTVLGACTAASSSPTVPVASGSARHYGQAEALHLAGQCIRQHGIPAFSDPTVDSTGQVTFDKTQLIAAPRAVLTQALLACRGALDRAGIREGHRRGIGGAPTPQQLAALLAFARCMRAHGLPAFADPNPATGDLILPPGVSKDSPVVQAATRACRHYLSKVG